MNLFEPEKQVNKEDKYLKDLHLKQMVQYNEFVAIRMEIRALVSGLDGLKLEIAKEILKTEKSEDKKIRKEFYDNIIKKYKEFNAC